MAWAWRNIRNQKHWKFQLAMRPVGLALLVWFLFFGRGMWAIGLFAAVVLVTTVAYLPDVFRRKGSSLRGE